MTVAELLAEAKRRARDSSIKPLWTDPEWLLFLNWAEQEACRRADLIWDTTTENVASLALTENTGWVALDRKVLRIERAGFAGRPLRLVERPALDVLYPDWEAVFDVPQLFMVTGRSLRLYPGNAAQGTLLLHVSRLPKTDLTLQTPSPSPEIPAQYHEALISGMLHKAYLKNDSETYNKGASDQHLADFARVFGPERPGDFVRVVAKAAARPRAASPQGQSAASPTAAPPEGGTGG